MNPLNFCPVICEELFVLLLRVIKIDVNVLNENLFVMFRLSPIKYTNMNETELLEYLQQTSKLVQLRVRWSQHISFYSRVTNFLTLISITLRSF